MSTGHVLSEILRTRLIVILRFGSETAALGAVHALERAEVPVAEISLTTPGVHRVLERSAAEGRRTILGAGTVRSVEQARAAVSAGAAFLVSPGFDPRVFEWAAANDVLHIPGVFTPSEVDGALSAGAPLLKLFPAGRLGPGYIRDLLAPFPEAKLVPTGGIDESNAPAFLDAGAAAIAVGSALVGHAGVEDPEQLGSALSRLRAVTAA